MIHMPEMQWTEDDFVQLARPKLMAAADPSTLPDQLIEFFSKALLHYHNATPEGKSYHDTIEARKTKNAIEPLQTLFKAWREKRLRGLSRSKRVGRGEVEANPPLVLKELIDQSGFVGRKSPCRRSASWAYVAIPLGRLR